MPSVTKEIRYYHARGLASFSFIVWQCLKRMLTVFPVCVRLSLLHQLYCIVTLVTGQS